MEIPSKAKKLGNGKNLRMEIKAHYKGIVRHEIYYDKSCLHEEQ